jgi:hypothetical protein
MSGRRKPPLEGMFPFHVPITQAELFYVLSISLSNYRPFPQLFSLLYALVIFTPTALVTGLILANFYLKRVFAEENRTNLGKMVLAVMVGKPVSLLFKALKGLSAADNVLHYLHKVRIDVRGSAPIHYKRTMALFRPAMADESER